MKGREIVQPVGHDPHSHWQHDGEATARVSAMTVACRALARRVSGSPKLSPDQIAAGRHVTVVHPSLRYGDLECVHADSVEVFQHGSPAGAA